MNLSPATIDQARADYVRLAEELRLAMQPYIAAAERLGRARPGTPEFRTWYAATMRHRKKVDLITIRMNRARATAAGEPWLRVVRSDRGSEA